MTDRFVVEGSLDSSTLDSRGQTAGGATFLDRRLDLGVVTWGAAAWVATVAIAIALRLAGLNVSALAPEEARRAYAAWLLYQGRAPLPGESLPQTAPFFLLLQSLSFFLFGVTDVTARVMPALLGLALVLLIFALRPFVGKAAALGMAVLAAFSPTLVYASRTATPEIVIACLAVLLLVALLRAGAAPGREGGAAKWSATAGVALGALLACGPSAITVLLSLIVGMIVAVTTDRDGAMRRALSAATNTPGAGVAFAASLVATILVLFTRFFSDLGAIAGVGRTVTDWVRLLAESSVGTPTQFFLLAVLLYEPLAVLLAIVAALRGRVNRGSGLGWPLFGGWFVAALVLWSFSSGRAPQHAVHVALPLVLLAGGVLGDLWAAVDRRDMVRGRGGALALAFVGLIVGLVAAVILVSRIDTALDQRAATVQAAIVVMLVVVPLGYAAFVLAGAERDARRRRQPWLLALLVPALFLGAFTLRSSILLSFYRADDGTELLAQRTPTAAIQPLVERIEHLSRDATVTQGSVRDTPGGRDLSIAVGRPVRWPFEWYFRDFPDVTIVDAGHVPAADAQVIIAADDAGMAEAGYTPRTYAWVNRVPPAYARLDTGEILGNTRASRSLARWGAVPPLPRRFGASGAGDGGGGTQW